MSSPAAQTIDHGTVKRANEAFATIGSKPRTPLFNEFWAEGEFAMLFGPAGVGKSLLAVDVAEMLAHDVVSDGENTGEKARRVLYVDLVLSEDQFGYRYSRETAEGMKAYPFSANLLRGTPDPEKDLVEWLRKAVTEHKIEVVIIDDLSMVAQTNDGTRETLRFMRSLRQMTREKGISTLVLADSQPLVDTHVAIERSLRRTQVLCSYADSVFAMLSGRTPNERSLVQTRSQGGEIVWTPETPARLSITEHDGLVGFDFVEPEMSSWERDLILEIRDMRANEMTFRAIADKLEISKSKAARLHARWTPAIEQWRLDQIAKKEAAETCKESGKKYELCNEECCIDIDDPANANFVATGIPDQEADDDYEEGGWDDEPWNADRRDGEERPEYVAVPEGPRPFDPPRIPFAAALRRRSVLDLERGRDHNNKEIYIESRDEQTGKLKVWYQRGPDYTKWVREPGGLIGTTIKHWPYMPREHPIAFKTPRRAPP